MLKISKSDNVQINCSTFPVGLPFIVALVTNIRNFRKCLENYFFQTMNSSCIVWQDFQYFAAGLLTDFSGIWLQGEPE